MTDTAVIEAHALKAVIDGRVRELAAWRRWYREHPYTLGWQVRVDNERELRDLVALRWKARRMARAAIAAERRRSADYWRGDHFVRPGVA